MYNKYHFKKSYKTLLILLIFAQPLSYSVYAQNQRAGSHLDANAIPSHITQLSNPDEINHIRQLLSNGEKNEALNSAQKYLLKVENNSLIQETIPRYYAYNAICTVYTHLGETDNAVKACSTAMSLHPDKWSAVNNRGTAYLVSGRYQEALEDYQLALSKAPLSNIAITETIEHNIDLARDRAESNID